MTASPIPDPIHREAAVAWFTRLQGEAALDDWTAFQAWLEADEAHRLAYDEVEALWLDLDEAEPLARSAPDQTVVPFRRPPRRVPVWAWSAGAVAAAAVVAVVVAPSLMQPAADTYVTAKGQVLTVALADGSKLTLGGDTQLSVSLARKHRDVVLAQGEASFDVAHDAARPFTVQAGDRDVRVLGTEFNILRADDRLAVTVRRGIVQVSDAAHGDVHRLTYGDQLVHKAGAPDSSVRKVQPDQAFAWKTGRLAYENTPLTQVAADLNRYVATPIRVDPGAANVKVTGVLMIDEGSVMLRRLELFAPVTAVKTSSEIVLKARTRPR